MSGPIEVAAGGQQSAGGGVLQAQRRPVNEMRQYVGYKAFHAASTPKEVYIIPSPAGATPPPSVCTPGQPSRRCSLLAELLAELLSGQPPLSLPGLSSRT